MSSAGETGPEPTGAAPSAAAVPGDPQEVPAAGTPEVAATPGLPEPARAAGTPEVAAPQAPAGSWDLDLAAASLRIDTTDTDAFFEALGNKLTRIMGTRVSVKREGGLRRNKRVVRIVVDTRAGRLEAARGRSGPVFYAAHAVRGITLQTSEIGADEWLERLVALVRDEAARSSDVRFALGRMLDT